MVLLVNALTRLAVVTPARDLAALPLRFAEGLAALSTLEIPARVIAAELRAMRDVTSTTSRSRSVLGTMNDYAIYIEAVFRHDVTPRAHG